MIKLLRLQKIGNDIYAIVLYEGREFRLDLSLTGLPWGIYDNPEGAEAKLNAVPGVIDLLEEITPVVHETFLDTLGRLLKHNEIWRGY